MAIVDPFKIQRPTPSTAAPSAPGAGARPIVDPFVPKLLRPQPKAPVAASGDRTWGEAATDTLKGVGSGINGLIRTAGTLGGLVTGNIDNPVTKFGAENQEFYRDWQSESLKRQRTERDNAIDAADGIVGSASAAVLETLKRPALIADLAAENLGPLGAIGAGARAAGAGARLLGAALPLASRAAVGGAIGTGAVLQAGDVAGNTYEAALRDTNWDSNTEYAERIAAGENPEAVKKELALGAARRVAPAAAAVSGLSQMLPGGTILERAVAGGIARPVLARSGVVGRALGGLRGAAGEGVQEAIEEGGGQFAGNLVRQQTLDPTTDLTQDVGSNAGLGFVGGGTLGGVAGALSRPHIPRPQPRAEATPEGVQRPAAQTQTAPATPAAPARPRYPDAAPGSLADAANAVPAGTATPAAPPPTDAAAVSRADAGGAAAAPQGGQASFESAVDSGAPTQPRPVITTPPWINPETGELTPPTEEQITQAMVVQLQAQADAGQAKTFYTGTLGRAWGLNDKTIRNARARALRLMADQNAGATQAEARAAERDQQQMELEEIIRGPREPEETNAAPAPATDSLETAQQPVGTAPAASGAEGQPPNVASAVSVPGVSGAQSEARADVAAVDGEALTDGAGGVSAAPAAVARERAVGAAEAAPADATGAAGVSGAQNAAAPKLSLRTSREESATNQILPNDGGRHADLARSVGDGMPLIQEPNREVDVPATSSVTEVGRGQAAADESHADAGVGNAEVAGNSVERPALSAKDDGLIKVPSRTDHEVLPNVGPLVQNREILERVVEPVAVDVVDDLAPAKRSPERSSHDQSVLEPLPANTVLDHANQSVARGVPRKAADVTARAGTTHTEALVSGGIDSSVASVSRRENAVDSAARDAAASPQNSLPEPSVAQMEAGNAKAGHIRLHGLDITIQVPKGGKRRGTDRTGGVWERAASAHYGHIRRTTGADGEQVDVYLGDRAGDPDASVYVVDQVSPETGAFDETKVMMGFPSARAARAAYEANFPAGMRTFGSIREMSVDEFKGWLREGDTTKPAADGAFDAGPERAPRAARGTSSDAHTLSVAKAVQEVVKGWGPNQPRVRVLRSAEELPAQAKRNPRYARARGWYDGKNSVYVVAPNVATVEQGLQTLIHEAIGHYGIDSIIDQHVEDGWKGLVGDIVRLRDSGAGSEATRAAIESTRRRYPGVDDVTFAKEFIAIMAERGVRNGLMGRVVAALRAWLRRFAPNLRYTDAEMRQLLARSEEFLSAGESLAARRAAVQAMAFSQQAPTFYSALASAVRTAKGAPRHASAKAWKEWLDGAQRRGEFKGDERAWLGVDVWLDSQVGNVSRQQVEEFIATNEVRVQEVLNEDSGAVAVEAAVTRWLADADARTFEDADGNWVAEFAGYPIQEMFDTRAEAQAALRAEAEKQVRDYEGVAREENTRFGKYVLPGGQNYRELLLTLPPTGQSRTYKSSHFPDIPNIIAHVRFNERTDVEGHRVLFVEEIQSDWHQEGRRKGYGPLGAPDAPFKAAWPMLAFKRALRWAAENGFDKVAWTTGQQQADRYDLRKQIGEMVYWRDGQDWGVSAVAPDGSTVLDQQTISDAELDSALGKDVAERMRRDEGESDSEFGFPMDPSLKALRGDNLSVGGEGMQAFYDRMLPNEVGKYVKRWGAKVGTLDLPRAGEMNLEGDSITPVTDRVHAIDVTPAMRQSVMEGQGLFSMPAESADALIDVMAKPDESLWQAAKGWAGGRWQDMKPTLLGGLQLRHLLELAEPLLPGVKQYAETTQRMATDRNQLLENVGELAQEWRDWAGEKGLAGLRGRQKPEAKVLSTLIHDVTIAGVDPSEAYRPLTFNDSRGEPVEFSRKGAAERIKEIRGQMRGRPGDDKTEMLEQIKFLKGLDARERARKADYPRLVARWQQLSPEAQAIYRKARDHYRQHSENVEAALIARVEALDVPETKKRALTENIRLQFETQRLEGVYFPLQRFGDYWISATSPSGEQAFVMFETYREFDRAAKQLAAGGYKIEATGRKDSNYKAKDAPSGTFVAEIVDQLKKAGAPETVQDQVYQTYLKALPEMSMRKHSIHRKSIAGYSGDAMRAFAKNGFHGAHQLAKLRFSHILTAQVDALQAALDNRRKGGMAPADAAAADALLGELRKRHDWILSPKDSQLANAASAIGFIYYLGVTPAAAIVNLTQGAQVTFPVLAAKYGAGKAGRMLWAATRDAMRTWGNIERTLTTDDDKAAYRVLRERGDIEKTQAHSLAGIAEGDTLRTNPTYAKVMNGVSYLFQRMEIINREAAGIAAFRLARSEGMAFDQAVQYASDILAGTHFDYSNANRARFMQGNVAKVLLQFRSYSLGMSWMLGRNLYQSFKGESPEVRRLARRTLTGILGMTALFSGAMGLPFIGVAGMVASALHAAFGDDDEPYDFQVEFRSWLAEHLGADAARWIADGAVNRLGADVAGRVGMADLWFREPDRELEGRDLYYHLLEQAAGPMGGIAKNVLVGKQQVADGHVWRGIETMLPKFAKDAMKSVRFATEGANTLRGDPIIEDVTNPERFIQVLGFTPTRLKEQYAVNRALKNYESFVLDRRQQLLNAFALGTRLQDEELRRAALERIAAFNRTYPEIRLDAMSIRRSLQTRARYSAQADAGVILNKRIADRVREQVAPTQ